MRGLMVKDFLITLTNKKMLVIMVFITMILMISNRGNNYSFIIAYFVVLCGMMTLSTISYDELNHGNSYLMTMPVTRSMYVWEKYLFSFISMLGGTIIIDVIFLLIRLVTHQPVELILLLATSGSIFIVLCLLMCIMIPLQLKFGADNGRIIILGFVGVVFIAGFALVQIAKYNNIDAWQVIQNAADYIFSARPIVIVLLTLAVIIAAIYVSSSISVGIMKKKEL